MEIISNKAEQMTLGGKRYLMFELSNNQVMSTIGEILSKVDNKEYKITIKRNTQKRSLSANGYFWKMINVLASVLGVPVELIYRSYIKNIGDNNVILEVINEAVPKFVENWAENGIGWICDKIEERNGKTELICYYGSSTYDSKQMSRLIEMLVFDCKEQNIETMTPNELNKLISLMESEK